MQITETVSEGLRREFRIVVDAKDLDEKLVGRLDEMKPRVHLKGFRPGKAPISFLKKTYGKSLMTDIVNEAATQGKDKAIADNSLKPAFPPRVELASELEQVVEGKADLEFTVTIDLMPDFELTDPAKLKIEKLVADVTDEEVESAVERLSEQARSYTARAPGEAAQTGDSIVMDFIGLHRRRGIPRRQGREFQSRSGLGPAHSRLRGSIAWRACGRQPRSERHVPGELSGAETRGQGCRVRREGERDQKPRCDCD